MPILHGMKVKMVGGFIEGLPLYKMFPNTYSSVGAARAETGPAAKRLGLTKVLIVTDKILQELGVINPCLESLQDCGVEYVVYNGVVPDPTEKEVTEGVKLYTENKCDGLVSIGGGSSIDCAKAVAVCVAHDNRPIGEFAGLFKVVNKLPGHIAIPTTHGTGSETTAGAVITMKDANGGTRKLVLADFGMMCEVAILDGSLLSGLPKGMTAATAMDAVTHSVEAYLSTWNDNKPHKKELCLQSIKTLLGTDAVMTAFQNPTDLENRQTVLYAAYQAGQALNYANVGYIHAVAHSLGAVFHTPHGMANAMVMPYVLEAFGESTHQKLAEMARAAGIPGKSDAELTKNFIQKIRDMMDAMDMPKTVKGMKHSDIDKICDMALAEAHGERESMFSSAFFQDSGYAVPTYLTKADFQKIVRNFVDRGSKL